VYSVRGPLSSASTFVLAAIAAADFLRVDWHVPVPVSVWRTSQHCVGLGVGVNSKLPAGFSAGRDLQRLSNVWWCLLLGSQAGR
jgi:hypothetical protein